MTLHDAHALLLRLLGPGLYVLAAVIAAELVNLLSLRKLNGLGLVPREAAGLPGIALSPLLHLDLRHFLANIAPLTVLVVLLGHLLPGRFWWVLGALTLGTGAAVWLLARRRNHLGASGVIYALLGYLTLHGFLASDWLSLGISAVLLVLYSGLLWDTLPTTARTSWESHLFGLAVGLALAWFRLV